MIDWGFWGVVVSIVAAILAFATIAVTIVLYFRAKATSVAVSATFDDSGFVSRSRLSCLTASGCNETLGSLLRQGEVSVRGMSRDKVALSDAEWSLSP
jgi:hypothetical protein